MHKEYHHLGLKERERKPQAPGKHKLRIKREDRDSSLDKLSPEYIIEL